ncbi:MAG TPA: HoxN/HupN/NixA family nickel/cobalt transporter [Mycobacteriales bacterium]|nr:HoxN/HupN/NixA family nickel/cobalt transporter [Mycobacteriales bacterium]
MSIATITAASSRLQAIRGGLSPKEWARLGAMVAFIVALYVVGFSLLAAAIPGHYVVSHHRGHVQLFGLGTGILALTLGMRHAFDADHISAIDNTTRKLMSDGKRPMSVGFFFSLGHSSIVFVMSVLLNLGIRTLDSQVSNGRSSLHTVTGIVGTSVSGTFLYLIAAVNLVILVSIVKVFLALRHGRFDDEELERQLNQRGMMNRFFGGLARRVDSPAKMYLVGLLFGLGFDTATEVALLVLSGTAVASGLPFWAILSLPLLFAAGMTTFDLLDGCFMNFAYGWAFSKPVRKVYYNITITALSVAVAFVIGTIEILGLLGSQLRLSGGFWHAMSSFDINSAGFIIVGLFVVTWVLALGVWRFGNVEARWEDAAARARARARLAEG